MKELKSLTNNFLKRFDELVKYLKSLDTNIEVYETFEPVSELEIKDVETKLGIKLNETFLAYFRESNGYDLKYSFNNAEGLEAAIMIPSLKEIFDEHLDSYCEEGESELEILGGRDYYKTRSNMYCVDKYDEWFDEGRYYAVQYLVSDNLFIFTDDYDACMTDSHPITPQAYFELCLATAGLVTRRDLLHKGYPDNFEVIDFSYEDYKDNYSWSELVENIKNDKVSLSLDKLKKLLKLK